MKWTVTGSVVLVGGLLLAIASRSSDPDRGGTGATATAAADTCAYRGTVVARGASACDPNDLHRMLACPETGGMTVQDDAERYCTVASAAVTARHVATWVSDPAYTVQILEADPDATVASAPSLR